MSISVIIPTFNRKDLLRKTLTNIDSQTRRPEEIIVIDDGSDDGTDHMISAEFPQVKYYRNKGKGPGAARNTGMEIATGEFIKFFDSDDLMTLNTLEVQSNILSGSSHQFVYGPYIHAKEEAEEKWVLTNPTVLFYYPVLESKTFHQWMCRGLFVCIPSMLFRKSFLERVGKWREDIVAYEDFDYLWRIISLDSDPLHSNECAFIYRIHGDQTTVSHFSHRERDQDKLKMLKGLENYSFTNLKGIDKIWLRNYMKPNYNGVLAPYFRIVKKIGRIKSKTIWQPEMGGVLNDSISENFLLNI